MPTQNVTSTRVLLSNIEAWSLHVWKLPTLYSLNIDNWGWITSAGAEMKAIRLKTKAIGWLCHLKKQFRVLLTWCHGEVVWRGRSSQRLKLEERVSFIPWISFASRSCRHLPKWSQCSIIDPYRSLESEQHLQNFTGAWRAFVHGLAAAWGGQRVKLLRPVLRSNFGSSTRICGSRSYIIGGVILQGLSAHNIIEELPL